MKMMMIMGALALTVAAAAPAQMTDAQRAKAHKCMAMSKKAMARSKSCMAMKRNGTMGDTSARPMPTDPMGNDAMPNNGMMPGNTMGNDMMPDNGMPANKM